MKPKYITRENNNYQIINNKEKKETLTQLLKKQYPYINQSMKHEKYKIEYEEFDLLLELTYQNKVVGIITIKDNKTIINTFCINEAYILPEFRSKGIFYKTLIVLITQPNKIAIRNPNKKIITHLLKYGLAKKLKNNLIISFINFIVDDTKIYTNKQTKTNKNNNHIKNELIETNFYDLNINSCVFLDVNNLENNTPNKAHIIKARLTDSKKDDYYKLLKNVDLVYLNNLKKRILSIDKEKIKFIEKTEENINQYFTIENILGTENNFTEFFNDKLKENNLTFTDGKIIRSQVKRALNNNEITARTIITRTIYLIKNYDKQYQYIKPEHETILSIEEKCPYCSTINYKTYETCTKCGYNIQQSYKDPKNLLKEITGEIISNELPEKLLLKEELKISQNKISQILQEELKYLEYDTDEVYNIHCIISTYLLLNDIIDEIYFNIYNYDLLYNIREGSAFNFAKSNNLIQQTCNYKYYIRIMEEFYPETQLRKILKENHLDTSGNKKELLKRIEVNINPMDIFGNKYGLTELGEEFLINNRFIDKYLDTFPEFTFYEYLLFTKNNTRKSEEELDEAFINYMRDVAINTGNYYKYHDFIRYNIRTSANLNEEDFLVFFTMLFIIDIGYWLKSRNHRKISKPLSLTVIEEFSGIKSLYTSHDINYIFLKAWDSVEIDCLKDNMKIIMFYFRKSLEYDDIDDINREIEYSTFMEEYLMYYQL